ncbi:hypothetical protein J7F03_19715 [Streptomyces sp. ISL-43]|uniref:hypothetical protein n=1 Tax=Streptomyces sp. ISL-43 TaxID=2819183 RepID=UPI001BE9F98B|nr:hypothetical protein [Streptomyces sp. ISL-43]MBT2449280.1 hypothetical protein [Streptomyces sp. ISL-43]
MYQPALQESMWQGSVNDYKTADNVYKLADQCQKIGTITAYCERVARNKCPNAVNET